MYNYLLPLLLFICFSFTNETELSIEISGIPHEKKGNLRIGIFKKDGFPDANKVVYNKITPVTHEKMNVIFNNINPGVYGIAVFHDQDKNGKLSKNNFGYPIEPYGFSNNKFGTFGPPEFEEISFKVIEGKKTSINLKLKN